MLPGSLRLTLVGTLVVALPSPVEPWVPQGDCKLRVQGNGSVTVNDATFIDWSSSSPCKFDGNGFELFIPFLNKKPTCTISGTATEDNVVFSIDNSAEYLDHCGAYQGITLTCVGPESKC